MDCVAQTGLLPVWVSFTLRDDQHLAGGETIAQAVKVVTQHQLARWSREESVGEIWEILFLGRDVCLPLDLTVPLPR